MWRVGAADLYDGTCLMASRITEASIAAYNQLRQLHVVLLVLCIILPLLYLAAVFRCGRAPHAPRMLLPAHHDAAAARTAVLSCMCAQLPLR